MHQSPDTISIEAIKDIQKTQRRIATSGGITMGLLLSLYFFTFAMLLDHGMTLVLIIEGFSTVLFIIAFIFINRLSFALARVRYSKREPHQRLTAQMKPDDVNSDAEVLLKSIAESI